MTSYYDDYIQYATSLIFRVRTFDFRNERFGQLIRVLIKL